MTSRSPQTCPYGRLRPRGQPRRCPPARAEAARRWAALSQQIFEVDQLACPTCHGVIRIVGFITQTSVIAYSTIARLRDGALGVLYERGDYAAITFVRLPLPRSCGAGPAR